jgi:hypothetical protein
MEKIILTIIAIIAFNFANCQEIATTESGKKVMLFDDGTYKVISSKQNQLVSNNTSSERQSEKVQCSGITKKGNRCKRMVTSSNGRCYQH